MLEILLSLAIVTQDQIPLRAAPNETAARHATLWQGDNLEVRGIKGDYLQVYDHRRERAGYIRATQARAYALRPEEAPKLKAIVDFLKDTPGAETMGIGHAAAYLKAAPAEAIDADIFDALGGMADRLARRASRLNGKPAETAVEHLEVAAAYGIATYGVERNGKITLCYDGEAFRRVLALPATGEQKARAALALTRHDCVKPTLTPQERLDLDTWRGQVLDQASGGDLPEVLKNRLKIRKAGVWASLAYQYARYPGDKPTAFNQAGQRALDELAAVNKSELADGDLAAYNEAAVRVGASRWAAQPQTIAKPAKGRPGIALSAGAPGETCVYVIDDRQPLGKPLFSRCTYSVVWPASLTVSRDGQAMTLAVQPLDTWREMWVFKKGETGWQLDVQPPAGDTPELGYVEFAGWVPGNQQLLAARETVTEGRTQTRFEQWNQNTLATEKWADKPGNLSLFYRWQDPLWKGGTVAVR